MALEGSLSLPVFLFFMMTVLLSLEAIRFQSDMMEALYQVGNQYAFAGYQIKYENETAPKADKEIKAYLDSQLYPYLCVAEGKEGISLQDLSDIYESGRIELTAEYRLKPFISWLPIGEIQVEERFISHGWTGFTGIETKDNREQEIYVYITKTGSKYHLSCHCTYLNVQIQAANYEEVAFLRNLSGEKYHACLKCGSGISGIVYITAGGNSYHSQSDCSSLKRTVYMIPLSEADGYEACNKCSG